MSKILIDEAKVKLVLEALESLSMNDYSGYEISKHETYKIDNAITAIREALAEQSAQQEAVAYWIPKAEQFCIADPSGRPFAKAWEPLYTSPPAQPQQEPWEHLKAYGYAPGGYMMTCRGCNTTVTGVDKRASRCMPCATKTAEQPAQQEPVGCEGAVVNGRVYADRLEHDYKFECEAGPLHLCTDWVEFRRCFEWLAQHTSPPAQRTWVGLTDEEANKIYKDGSTFGEMMRMVEAKLKEKNT